MESRDDRLARIQVGDVISETFSTLFQKFATLALFIFICSAVLIALVFAAGESTVLLLLVQFLSSIVSLVILGFVILIVKEQRDQEKTAIGQILGQVSPHIVSLFLSSIVKAVAIFIGLILLIFPGVYIALRFSLSESAIVNEGLGPIEGLKRSFEMTREINLRLFLILLLVLLIAIAIGFGAGFPIGITIAVASLFSEILGIIIAVLLFSALFVITYLIGALWAPIVYFRLLEGEDADEHGETDIANTNPAGE